MFTDLTPTLKVERLFPIDLSTVQSKKQQLMTKTRDSNRTKTAAKQETTGAILRLLIVKLHERRTTNRTAFTYIARGGR